jgi:beta-lactamase regulating signal transducer with metallopeptidase domain
MAAALAVIATLAGLMCRRPALVHALWLLVLLKLVTPPLVSFSVRPAPRPVETARAAPSQEIPLAETEPVAAEEPEALNEGGEEEMPHEEAVERIDAVECPVPEERAEFAWVEWAPTSDGWARGLAAAWLIGSGCWFTLAIGRLWRFSRAKRHARVAPALQRRVNGLAGRMGLSYVPRVLLLPGRLAPMIWGASRPVLLVPEGLETMVGDNGLETLLLHELAHVRRCDHLVRVLEFVVLGLFWWNPVAWYARRELREAEEQCCDAWVVRTLPGTGRTYATALVDALDFLCGSRPALPPLASGLGEVADLKRRLKMILTGKTPHGLGRSNGLVVLGLALFLLPLVPVWGRAQDAVERKTVINERDIEVGAAAQESADAKKIEADIEKKAAELALLKARMAELKRATLESSKKKLADAIKEVQKRVVVQRSATPAIRIEISGLDMKADELKDLVKKLEAVLPGKEKRVVIVAGTDPRTGVVLGMGGAGGTYAYRLRSGEAVKAPPAAGWGVPRSATPPGPGAAPAAPGTPAPPPVARPGSTDRRIDGLEKKLDLLLRELEALRKDMRRGGPRGGAGGAGAGAGGGAGGSGGFGAPAKREGDPARP